MVSMAGIYIHIPFCRQKCHYCNFHFSVSQRNKEKLIEAICIEIERRKSFIKGEKIETIYFGGGTPSVLNASELNKIMKVVRKSFVLNQNPEITLEANPDDLNSEYLIQLNDIGFNRLSIGIQSFDEADLKLMNRSHSSKQARQSIENALKAGFENLSIDLIFSMPGSDIEKWKSNLTKALEYPIPHFSFYNLTLENRTALHHFVEQGKVKMLSDEEMAGQFSFTMEFMENAGFEHYEISNYARPGRYARHNTSYWQGKNYLGVGPSAHSFDGQARSWNIANNPKYIKSIMSGEFLLQTEILSQDEKYNEFIMTGLRTQWGCDLDRLKDFGKKYEEYFIAEISKEMQKGRVFRDDKTFILSKEGKVFADEVASNLFFV